jgi:DNA repair exonuclease SbcCD ATPase subunit
MISLYLELIMIRITKLTLKNFLSVGNVTQAINLDSAGLTLVLGENTDGTGGVTRNGAGKTSILQAISYALYGKPLTKIKIPNLVNNINNKAMLVTIEFERDGKSYRIERGQKPVTMRFYVNNTETSSDDQAQGENRHTQEEIERLIGMSHTMFKHVLALNTFTEPFLKMTVSEQRAVIEELLGVTQISQRADELKRIMNGPDGTKDQIRDLEADLKATTEANSRIEVTIKQAETNSSNWLKHHVHAVAELEAEIQAVQDINFEAEIVAFDALDAFDTKLRELRVVEDAESREAARLQREVDSVCSQADRYRKEATALDPEVQIARLRTEISRKEKDAERHSSQAARLTEELTVIMHEIEHSDEHSCRTCGQGLSGTDHLKTVQANLEKQKETLEAKITRELASLDSLTNEIENVLKVEMNKVRSDSEQRVTELIARAEEQQVRCTEVQADVTEQDSRWKAAKDAIKALGARPVTTFKSRDEVYKAKQLYEMLVRDLEKENEKVNPYTQQIDSLKETLQKIDMAPLNDLTVLMKHQDFLLKLLTSKDSFIRKRIIDQNLAYLNSRLNQYLDKLGLPHEVRFVSDLSVEITLLGRDFDFEQLSRGEMNRVIMATSLSFRDVWESLNNSVNLLWVDELIDNGLDDQGAEAALEILKGLARDRGKNVFLISHKDNLRSRVSRILMVHKEDSFTKFEDDAVV